MVREKAARAFRDYSVAANPFSSTVDPRWEAVKAEANQALKDGDLDRAVAGYTNALKIADADEHVDELFAVLSQRPNGSVGHKLDAAKADLAPIIRKFVPGPNLSRGEPNQPAAICLANRAAVHLKAGRVVEAVGDARLAAIICPEYIKAHFRLRQALLAVGDRAEELEAALLPALMPIGSEWEAPSGPPTAASVEASLKRFEALSKPEPLDQHGRQPPGIWLGFRLVICFLLDPAVYFAVYEEPRTRAWRELARRVMENVLTPPACAYDYRYLRVHMCSTSRARARTTASTTLASASTSSPHGRACAPAGRIHPRRAWRTFSARWSRRRCPRSTIGTSVCPRSSTSRTSRRRAA